MIKKITPTILRFAMFVCLFAFTVAPVLADIPSEPIKPDRKRGCAPLNLAEIGALFCALGAAGCLMKNARQEKNRDDA